LYQRITRNVSTAPQLYINGRFLCCKATGVQKYAIGLANALQKLYPDALIILPVGDYNCYGLNVIKSGWGSGFFWEQYWLPLYLWFHSRPLLINLCNTAPLLYKKQIVTVHDLAFLKDKKWFSPAFKRWYTYLIPRLCKRALAVITVSEFIKKEIENTYSISSQKINVAPNSIPDMEFDEQKPFPFHYLFLTGIYNERKNADFVISLLPELKKKNYHIVGVGVSAAIYGKKEFMHDENLHILEYVDEKYYYTLMRHADALVFPSTYEGFGIPVLEALCLGTTAIVPDIPVYRESYGEMPVYYNVSDAESFLKALEKINIHKPSQKDLSLLKNKYNFTKSADILFEIIKPKLR